MYEFKRILVALDLTAMDEFVAAYAAMFARVVQPEKVYLFHVAKSFDLPEAVQAEFGDVLMPVDEELTKKVHGYVDQYFKGMECSFEVVVKEGNAYDQILRWTDLKLVDLMIAGKKSTLPGTGVVPGKLARLMHCSLLFVPENPPASLAPIWVPVDFSNHSRMALQQALVLNDKIQNQQRGIMCHHVYHLPSGFHKSGKSREEFAAIMQGHAQNDYKKFLNEIGTPEEELQVEYTLDDNLDPSDKIHEQAEGAGAKLIIMGSQGRTKMAAMLLGSIAEKTLGRVNTVPVLIVKDKQKNMSWFEALLKL